MHIPALDHLITGYQSYYSNIKVVTRKGFKKSLQTTKNITLLPLEINNRQIMNIHKLKSRI